MSVIVLIRALWVLSHCPVPVVGEVSSPYGWRDDPITEERKFHSGLDIAAPEGSAIWLPFDTRVKRIVNAGSFGKHLILESKHGTLTLAHLSDWTVRKEQEIPAWTIVGHVGQTGRATGPHLHIELKKGKRRHNPADLFSCWERPIPE